MFFKKAAECLKKEGHPVKFIVHWYPFLGYGETEEIGEGSRVVEVHFVNIGNSNDVKGMFKEISKSEIADLIERESNEVIFNLTGGQATTSIAMMLHAIKGDTHAEYAKQNVSNVEPEELLVSVDLDVLELDDLVRELLKYFERLYERG